jgi:flagellar FliJ protein
MSFQFRFAAILQLRRRQRDEAGAEVGKALEAIRRIDEQSEAIRAQRRALREDTSGERVGDVTVDALLAKGRYDLQLQADLHALSETRVQLVQELERRQQALVAAEVEAQRFQRLEEKERAAAYAEALRRQQAEADDASASRYTIQQQQQQQQQQS